MTIVGVCTTMMATLTYGCQEFLLHGHLREKFYDFTTRFVGHTLL